MNNNIKDDLPKLMNDCENKLLLAEVKTSLTSGNYNKRLVG